MFRKSKGGKKPEEFHSDHCVWMWKIMACIPYIGIVLIRQDEQRATKKKQKRKEEEEEKKRIPSQRNSLYMSNEQVQQGQNNSTWSFLHLTLQEKKKT